MRGRGAAFYMRARAVKLHRMRELRDSSGAEPDDRETLKRVLSSVACVYLGYAALRLFLPVGIGFWGLLLIMAFYWVPSYVMRDDPEFVDKELELEEGGRLIPRWSWPGFWVFGRASLLVFPLFSLAFFAFYQRVCAGDVQSLSWLLWLEDLTPLSGRLSAFWERLCSSYQAEFWPKQLHWPERWTQYGGAGFLLELAVGIFAIALPEEIFHRGYLQGALEKRFPPRFTLWGAKIGLAAVLASAIFALGHLVSLQETSRLATFFPSLLFAWLWRRSGSLWAPTLFHAASNLLMDLLLATTFPST